MIARHALLLLLCLSLQGCAPVATRAADTVSTVRFAPLPLDGDDAGRQRIGALRYLDGYVLSSGDRDFGGLSALSFLADGTLLVASDRTTLWRVPVTFAADGATNWPRNWAKTVLHGQRDPNGRRWQDAESLDQAANGAVLIAFEHGGGVWRGDPFAQPPQLDALPLPADVLDQPDNGGLEAMAVLPGDGLALFSERRQLGNGAYAAWLYRDGAAQRFAYRPGGGFVPTGAAALGQWLYILERQFSFLAGFQARLVRVRLAAVQPGAAVEGELLARLAGSVNVDNFEGLAARVRPDGRHELVIVSDDNFQALQRTLLMRFAVEAG